MTGDRRNLRADRRRSDPWCPAHGGDGRDQQQDGQGHAGARGHHGRAWRMRQDSRLPSYTTELGDVPVVRA
ncbi:DUF4113 domain-containing protein [Azospirillum baldaniorum]|uniref:DUF4113 domain-containing protein n=1 Tax=Azospirillum baldaniorum TaxID=1064539 RepID=UPI00117F7ADC